MTRARELRKRLGHPVIDGDAHLLEMDAVFEDYLREIAGNRVLEACRTMAKFPWYAATPEERHRRRIVRPPWGLNAKNGYDLATSMLPKLMYERLDDFGIDFMIVYPTSALAYSRHPDEEVRRGACRAMNTYFADLFRGLDDRMTPAALIPMVHPDEAIAELEHVAELGLKVIAIANAIPRPIAAFAERFPDADPDSARAATWLDSFGIDSAYDYDPFWRACVKHKVAPTAHQSGHWGSRTSVSNYVHNHLGLFGSAGEALCRSLFLSGVTYRIPELRIGFLEGGVGWATSLLSDLVEHWEKRNKDCLSNFAYSSLDQGALRDYVRRYGGDDWATKLGPDLAASCPFMYTLAGWCLKDSELVDEWAACHIEREDDIGSRFVPRFFFGCEGDDRIVATAFDRRLNPFGAKLGAFFGSDIGHWDVEAMDEVLVHAAKLLDRKLLTEEDFEDFTFGNAVRLHAGANPEFFKGTTIEREAAAVLARVPTPLPTKT